MRQGRTGASQGMKGTVVSGCGIRAEHLRVITEHNIRAVRRLISLSA